MNTSVETMQHQSSRGTGLKWVAGGSMVEAIGALATIALAIVGLAGVLSAPLAAIATIIFGAAILIECGAFATGRAVNAKMSAERMAEYGANSPEFLGGVAGIILGILALLGVAAATLLSVAVLVYGGTLLLSSISSRAESGTFESGLELGSGSRLMVGVAAVVLGILAIVGSSSLTLVLVGLLTLGAAALFSGSMTSARSFISHERV